MCEDYLTRNLYYWHFSRLFVRENLWDAGLKEEICSLNIDGLGDCISGFEFLKTSDVNELNSPANINDPIEDRFVGDIRSSICDI